MRHLLSLSYSSIFKNEIAWNEWEITAPSDMGSQSNGYDCGVCVCVWAYCISTGLTPPSAQEICASSTAVRTWMQNLLLSKAVKTERSVRVLHINCVRLISSFLWCSSCSKTHLLFYAKYWFIFMIYDCSNSESLLLFSD